MLDFLNQTFWDAIKANIQDINNRALSLCSTALSLLTARRACCCLSTLPLQEALLSLRRLRRPS